MQSRTLMLALAASALSLPAPRAADAAPALRSVIDSARGAVAPDSARIRTILTKVDASLQAGRISEARNLYRTLINEQRASEQYAGEALWGLAETYFAADDTRGAARVLDEVAEDAARFGDPAMELKATFEAALLYQQMKRLTAVAFRLPRIKALLQSPAVSKEEKLDFERRLEK